MNPGGRLHRRCLAFSVHVDLFVALLWGRWTIEPGFYIFLLHSTQIADGRLTVFSMLPACLTVP